MSNPGGEVFFPFAPRVRFVPMDEISAAFSAEVYKGLRQKGRPLPTNDLWNAASAF